MTQNDQKWPKKDQKKDKKKDQKGLKKTKNGSTWYKGLKNRKQRWKEQNYQKWPKMTQND